MHKRLTHAIAIVALCGIAAACAGRGLPGDATPRTELTSWCSAYAGLLQTAAANKADMDQAARTTVTSIRRTVGPLCSDIDGVESTETALVTVRNAVRDLRQIPALKEDNQ